MKRPLLGFLDRVGVLPLALRARDRWRYRKNRETREADEEFLAAGAPDGLPLPPPELIYLVTGQFSSRAFFQNGVEGAAAIRRTVETAGLRMENFGSILDFGCGCGRVLRQWKDLGCKRLHGSDLNPVLARWCGENLPFASIRTNLLDAETRYDDESFDFIYAISVFTHLGLPLQRFWMDELRRILAPGGVLYFTVHGESRCDILTGDERRRFDAGEFVLRHDGYEGKNLCSAFHPERFVRDDLCREFDVLVYASEGATDARQDAVLVRKR